MAGNTIKIGGELESMATGKIVAAASAIKDKSRNKTQEVINGDVEAAIAEQSAQFEALSEETSEAVAFASQSARDAKQYLADLQEAITELPDGQAVSAQVAVNEVDIAGLKSDVVVDLSTRYATSYANLSAALTALNSDTATDAAAIKKAGVSIKFINSTTNKYEQWNLKASSWNTDTSDWGNTNVTQASEVVYNGQSLSDILVPLDNISKQNAQSEEQAIIYETDGGAQVGKIDANGADFINLKRGGQQVARMSDLPTVPTLDTSIGSNPSNSHTPSTKAVKDYVDANSGGDYPIDTETTSSQEEKVWFGNDAGTDTYAEINAQGIKAKKYFDANGNEIIFKQPYYILDANGNGDFTSVSSAISSAPKLSTILVVAGEYSVKNCTFNKGQHFIGLSNTGECVFYVDDGQYSSAPRANNGSFENIAFESRHQDVNTSRRAYCVHIDFVQKVQGVPFEVKFVNCTFKSWNADCVGCGGAKDLKVIFVNCRLYQYGNDGYGEHVQLNPSCFAMHAAANMAPTSEYAGPVYVYIKDCILITYTKSALRFGGDKYVGTDNIVIPGGGEWELINNTLYSFKDNNGTPYGTNCVTSGSGGNEEPISTFPISGKDWTLSPFNNGNNVRLLNQ